jgi:hypothetical protein
MSWGFLEGLAEANPPPLPPSVHIVAVEFNQNGLPNDAIHISGLGSEDGGILKLNSLSQIDAAPIQLGLFSTLVC